MNVDSGTDPVRFTGKRSAQEYSPYPTWIGRLAGRSLDIRRFRQNVVVRLLRSGASQKDKWLGGVLSFGDGNDAPAIAVTMRDERCGMVNFDPDLARLAPEVMKAVVRANQNNAGIYGTVTRTARLTVGQTIFILPCGAEARRLEHARSE